MNILVTGGSSGLGKEITELFAQDTDNKVYFTYNSSAAAAEEIEGRFQNAKAIACNFREERSVLELTDRMEGFDLDILVNNAHAKYNQQHFYKIPAEDFIDDFRLNILPTLQITQKAIGVFRKKRSGRIINIISSAVQGVPPVGMSLYTAQKAYLLSMSKSWAAEGIRFNITSNCISPAFMETQMTAGYDDRTVEQLVAAHPLKKLLQPAEVAEAVLYLAGASRQINGINLVMNAGAGMS